MWDTNVIFTNDVTVNATGTSSIIDTGPSRAGGEWVEIVNTGTVTGTATPTMAAKVQASDSPTFASGVRDLASFDPITAQGSRDAVLVQHEERYLRISYTLTGATPVFNGVRCGVVSGPQRDHTV